MERVVGKKRPTTKPKSKADFTTRAEIGEHKNNPTIAIWEVDDEGYDVGEYPTIAFGIKKAKAIMKHIKDIEEFLKGNS